MRTYTFAVPPCFAALSREQPFRVQIHPCLVTGVPGGSYFCSHEHRFAATAHKAVSACLRPWLAPSASSLPPGDQPTSLAQRLFVLSLPRVSSSMGFVKTKANLLPVTAQWREQPRHDCWCRSPSRRLPALQGRHCPSRYRVPPDGASPGHSPHRQWPPCWLV